MGESPLSRLVRFLLLATRLRGMPVHGSDDLCRRSGDDWTASITFSNLSIAITPPGQLFLTAEVSPHDVLLKPVPLKLLKGSDHGHGRL